MPKNTDMSGRILTSGNPHVANVTCCVAFIPIHTQSPQFHRPSHSNQSIDTKWTIDFNKRRNKLDSKNLNQYVLNTSINSVTS